MTTGPPPPGTRSFGRWNSTLLSQLESRAAGLADQQVRWRRLLDAVIDLASDLERDAVLARTAAAARHLTGAGRVVVMPSVATEEEPTFRADPVLDPAPVLEVPIRSAGRDHARLELTGPCGKGFSHEDREVLSALAGAAGVVLENARLYRVAQQRERWLAATADVVRWLGDGDATAAEILQVLTDRAREAGGADGAWIVARTEGEDLELLAVSGPGLELDRLRSLPVRESLSGHVITSGVPVAVTNLTDDPRRVAPPDGVELPTWGPAVVVPFSLDGRTAGTLTLAWRPQRHDALDDLDPELPGGFAVQAALALQLVRARRDRERLALLEARDRIGRELHEVVVQRLLITGFELEGMRGLTADHLAAKRIAAAVDDLDEAVREIRSVVYDLSVPVDEPQLADEVRRLVHRMQTAHAFKAEVEVARGPEVPAALVPDLLAVLGEALSNVGRHGHASRVEVRIQGGAELVLVVHDDGVGFGPDVVESGVANMRGRAEARGGSMSVTSERGAGTTLTWRVPVGAPAEG